MMFFFVHKTQICSYANDTAIHECHTDLSTIISNSQADDSVLTNWFSSNFVNLHDDKCHLMISCKKINGAAVKIGNSEIKELNSKNYLALLLVKTKF